MVTALKTSLWILGNLPTVETSRMSWTKPKPTPKSKRGRSRRRRRVRPQSPKMRLSMVSPSQLRQSIRPSHRHSQVLLWWLKFLDVALLDLKIFKRIHKRLFLEISKKTHSFKNSIICQLKTDYFAPKSPEVDIFCTKICPNKLEIGKIQGILEKKIPFF